MLYCIMVYICVLHIYICYHAVYIYICIHILNMYTYSATIHMPALRSYAGQLKVYSLRMLPLMYACRVSRMAESIGESAISLRSNQVSRCAHNYSQYKEVHADSTSVFYQPSFTNLIAQFSNTFMRQTYMYTSIYILCMCTYEYTFI